MLQIFTKKTFSGRNIGTRGSQGDSGDIIIGPKGIPASQGLEGGYRKSRTNM